LWTLKERSQWEGVKTTKSLEKRMELARLILHKLEQQPLRWTPLLKAMIHVSGSPPRLYYILKYLEKNGFVKHEIINEKPHWTATEKGKELLKALSKDSSS